MFSNKLNGIFVDSVSEAKKREFKYISKKAIIKLIGRKD